MKSPGEWWRYTSFDINPVVRSESYFGAEGQNTLSKIVKCTRACVCAYTPVSRGTCPAAWVPTCHWLGESFLKFYRKPNTSDFESLLSKEAQDFLVTVILAVSPVHGLVISPFQLRCTNQLACPHATLPWWWRQKAHRSLWGAQPQRNASWHFGRVQGHDFFFSSLIF